VVGDDETVIHTAPHGQRAKRPSFGIDQNGTDRLAARRFPGRMKNVVFEIQPARQGQRIQLEFTFADGLDGQGHTAMPVTMRQERRGLETLISSLFKASLSNLLHCYYGIMANTGERPI
jgi:hypothetical protein